MNNNQNTTPEENSSQAAPLPKQEATGGLGQESPKSESLAGVKDDQSAIGEASTTPANNVPESVEENIKVDSDGSDKKSISISFETVKDYIILIVSFLVVAASIFLLIIPQYSRFQELSSSKESSQSELEDVQSQREYLESLVGLRDELAQNVELAEQALPTEENEIPFILDQLIQIADQSNLEIDSLSLGGSVDSSTATAGEPIQIRFQMSISGSFANVERFFRDVEDARRLLKINNFQYTLRTSPAAADSGVAEESVNISLTLYSYIMPQVVVGSVSIESLAAAPRYDEVIEYISRKRYYSPQEFTPLNSQSNPFNIEGIEVGENQIPENPESNEPSATEPEVQDADGFGPVGDEVTNENEADPEFTGISP